jgi:hypothetical protein
MAEMDQAPAMVLMVSSLAVEAELLKPVLKAAKVVMVKCISGG